MEKEFNWRTRVIAIDFDGCLCQDHYPDIGAPNWEVITEAKRLQKDGACLILWTCREGEALEAAVAACRDWGLEFDEVNANAKHLIELFGNDCRKLGADEYWDDKSVYMGFTEGFWRSIRGATVTLRSRENIRRFINEGLRPQIERMHAFYENGPPAELKPNDYEDLASVMSEALEQMEFLMAVADERCNKQEAGVENPLELYTIIHTSVDADRGSFPPPSAESSHLSLAQAQEAMCALVEQEKESRDFHCDAESYREEYSDTHWEAYEEGYAAANFSRFDIMATKLPYGAAIQMAVQLEQGGQK